MARGEGPAVGYCEYGEEIQERERDLEARALDGEVGEVGLAALAEGEVGEARVAREVEVEQAAVAEGREHGAEAEGDVAEAC